MNFVTLTIVDDWYKLQSSASISHFILRPNILGSPLFSDSFTSIVFPKSKRLCSKFQDRYILVQVMRFPVIVECIKTTLTL
jgi:hypothetical protein